VISGGAIVGGGIRIKANANKTTVAPNMLPTIMPDFSMSLKSNLLYL
jgi:hypothetical protein